MYKTYYETYTILYTMKCIVHIYYETCTIRHTLYIILQDLYYILYKSCSIIFSVGLTVYYIIVYTCIRLIV